MTAAGRSLVRLLALLLVSTLALQAYFAARVALMIVADPQSTTFQRSEVWRLARSSRPFAWQRQWLPYERIALPLKRAVVAAEDAGFSTHGGVEWDAMKRAWERNRRSEARAEASMAGMAFAHGAPAPTDAVRLAAAADAKLVGGSTITQQLAKNLFLAGERSLVRKAQEALIAGLLEALLGKRRILEIYLNSVEWGEGVFGAEAAARRYFRTGADRLGAAQAAQLAVLLPAPKRYEKRPGSAFVVHRAGAIGARMTSVVLP